MDEAQRVIEESLVKRALARREREAAQRRALERIPFADVRRCRPAEYQDMRLGFYVDAMGRASADIQVVVLKSFEALLGRMYKAVWFSLAGDLLVLQSARLTDDKIRVRWRMVIDVVSECLSAKKDGGRQMTATQTAEFLLLSVRARLEGMQDPLDEHHARGLFVGSMDRASWLV